MSCELGKGAHSWPPGPLVAPGPPRLPVGRLMSAHVATFMEAVSLPPTGKRRRFWAPFGLLGPWAALGGQIWAQMPLVGLTGWVKSISCAWAPETSTALLRPPKGTVLTQPERPFLGPRRSLMITHLSLNFNRIETPMCSFLVCLTWGCEINSLCSSMMILF